jgi:phosphoribosylglycinamide formyltransferase 1
MKKKMTRIAIFASGGGSNALKIIEYFAHHSSIEVALVVSNKKDAGVLTIAQAHHIPSVIVSKSTFYETEDILQALSHYKISFIVLAGFLLLVPQYIISRFNKKIVNIHPALLPKYGGKGMYGHHVHEAVKAAGDTESGLTIHYATEHYDEGDILFQARCALEPQDTAEDIARKVLQLEHAHYAKVIERLILQPKP